MTIYYIIGLHNSVIQISWKFCCVWCNAEQLDTVDHQFDYFILGLQLKNIFIII